MRLLRGCVLAALEKVATGVCASSLAFMSAHLDDAESLVNGEAQQADALAAAAMETVGAENIEKDAAEP